jgi:hypothetical protein
MTAHHVVATPAGPVNYRPLAPGSERLPQVFGCDYEEVPEGPGDGHTRLAPRTHRVYVTAP